MTRKLYYITAFAIAVAVGAQADEPHTTVGHGPCAIKVATSHYDQHIEAARLYVAGCEVAS